MRTHTIHPPTIYPPGGSQAHPVFQSGPERGGKSIGGTFWTDIKALRSPRTNTALIPELVQIVGHSASPCDTTDPSCDVVRSTDELSLIDVDVGMYGFWVESPGG